MIERLLPVCGAHGATPVVRVFSIPRRLLLRASASIRLASYGRFHFSLSARIEDTTQQASTKLATAFD